jgi:rhodanese-related sulfurtransferase
MKKIQVIALFLFAFTGFLKAQTLPADKFQQQLKKEKGILVDVRTPGEFNTERIKGAINIDVNDSAFVSTISKLDKNKPYFLYCGIGKRSARAAAIMREHGFKMVYDLEKGLEGWKAQGKPTENPSAIK